MNEQQVDILDAQFLQAILHRMDEMPAAEIVTADLGHQEDLVAFDSGSGDRLADILLIVIKLSAIDMAQPQIERHGDAVTAFRASQRIGAVSQKRYAIGRLHGAFLSKPCFSPPAP